MLPMQPICGMTLSGAPAEDSSKSLSDGFPSLAECGLRPRGRRKWDRALRRLRFRRHPRKSVEANKVVPGHVIKVGDPEMLRVFEKITHCCVDPRV